MRMRNGGYKEGYLKQNGRHLLLLLYGIVLECCCQYKKYSYSPCAYHHTISEKEYSYPFEKGNRRVNFPSFTSAVVELLADSFTRYR